MMNLRKRILLIMLSIVLALSGVSTSFAAEAKSETWNSEDFTYAEYSKLLYGCDYTRQFTVSGMAVSGLSESGEAKLETNKDLVIPATDNEGNTIVGVAENAFKEKGLTSVKFPTGMMVDYDDTISGKITKRGNFVIAEGAFSGNELTSVTLPDGVIACLSYAFNNNKLETVKLPKTIWWLETMSFSNNNLKTVQFPTSCDFQLEMHGLTFAQNFIQSVRLPNYTEVVNKDAFAWNTGKEPLAEDAKESYKTYTKDGVTYDAGVVYMYTDNASLASKDRIHHTGKSTASQKSYVQKLVVNDGSDSTQNPDQPWKIEDFTYDGTTITGLSESGVLKRAEQKDLILPDVNPEGVYITEIASAEPAGNGLFAAEGEGFDSVYLPEKLEVVGDYAFQNSGLKEVTFPATLKKIGKVAFQTNNLTSVILPDSVTELGTGAFATNPLLERINLSKGLTEIPEAAFGCSDKYNYMTNLTSIKLHEGITNIGRRAFAGNNFKEIVIPSTVKTIGDYAFSTKNYLTTPCTVTLNEGLETIGEYAFRNKVISEITLPATVTSIQENTFCKEYSDSTEVMVTKVYVSLKSQYQDAEHFPASEYHQICLTDAKEWTSEDFTYGENTFPLYPEGEVSVWSITGFSEEGQSKIEENKKLKIPAKDSAGKAVQGIAANVFADLELTNAEITEGIAYIGENALAGNLFTTIAIPASVHVIDKAAFQNNAIASLEFAELSDNALQIDENAFESNSIKAVQLPSNTERVAADAFKNNTGMETLTDGSGLVYMYQDAETAGEYIAYKSAGTSDVQELFLGNLSEEQKPWGVNDFIYDEAGVTILGLSDTGKGKMKENPSVILPKTGPSGEAVTALGDGENMQGIFVVTDGGKNYTPESIQLPDTLTKIGKWTFALNASLTYEADMKDIRLPNSLKEIGMTAFQNSKLSSITLPDSVTVLGQGAFTGSANLKQVRLSAGLVDIPNAAFTAGSATDMKLETVVIPEGVKTIGSNAFAGTHVVSVSLPDSLVTIGSNAFTNHQMKKLVIPEGVTTIGDSAFRVYQEGLEKTLTSLVLQEGLVTIGKEAFSGSKITEIDLPSTVVLSAKNSAADAIFGKANAPADPIVILKVSDESKVEAYNTAYANEWSHVVVYDKLVGTGWEESDFTYDEAAGILTGWSAAGQEKRKTIKDLVLPNETPEGNKIVAIGDEAFKIPDDEVIITKFGVDSPEGMKTVDLPIHLKTIGKEALAQNALTNVDLGSVTVIGESAFYGNDLVKAIIPDTVTSLGQGAFATNDITELKISKNITVIPQGAFSMNIRLESVTIPEKVTEIGTTAFAGARLTTLTIPKNVKKIGEKAFHLHHLTELTIPGNVKEIGDSAFEGTFKATTLSKLTIEEGVEKIGKYAFKEALLETVHFPNSLKTVGEKPFQNNKGKDGSQVVEVTTYNLNHLQLEDTTFDVKFKGSADITKMTAALAYTKVTYNGSYLKPAVTIKGLTEGEDFTVTYAGNKYPGTATVTIKGKGSFKGTVTKKFTISAPKVEAQKSVSVNLYGHDDFVASWSSQKIAGATVKYKVEYKVYKGSWKKLSSGTTATSIKKANLSDGKKYCFRITPYVTINKKNYVGTSKTSSYVYALKKISTPKLSKKGTNVKVSWTNIGGETGYQISQHTSKSKTKVVKTVESSSAKSVYVSATKGKYYYYKVRAYKRVNGKVIYGPWSSTKRYKR